MDEFYTIRNDTSSEITEKKSKFIAHLFYVENKNQIDDIVKETKKIYHDARHNCIAYRIIENGNILEKSSDDGEPSGTAGSPMLEVLQKNNLCNVLLIVTRYFGGILLGTGGLVRAYTEATLKVIEKSEKIKKCFGYLAEVELDYKTIDDFKHYCKNNKIEIISIDYLETVNCRIEFDMKLKDKINDDISNKKINIHRLNILCNKMINKSI